LGQIWEKPAREAAYQGAGGWRSIPAVPGWPA